MSDHTPGIIHEAPLYNIIADFGIGVKSHCLQISFSSCTTEETMIWNNLVYGEMEFMGFHLKKAFVKREVPGLNLHSILRVGARSHPGKERGGWCQLRAHEWLLSSWIFPKWMEWLFKLCLRIHCSKP